MKAPFCINPLFAELIDKHFHLPNGSTPTPMGQTSNETGDTICIEPGELRAYDIIPRVPASDPAYCKHVHCEGARFHLLSWSTQGVRCSEPLCIRNKRVSLTSSVESKPAETIIIQALLQENAILKQRLEAGAEVEAQMFR